MSRYPRAGARRSGVMAMAFATVLALPEPPAARPGVAAIASLVPRIGVPRRLRADVSAPGRVALFITLLDG